MHTQPLPSVSPFCKTVAAAAAAAMDSRPAARAVAKGVGQRRSLCALTPVRFGAERVQGNLINVYQ